MTAGHRAKGKGLLFAPSGGSRSVLCLRHGRRAVFRDIRGDEKDESRLGSEVMSQDLGPTGALKGPYKWLGGEVTTDEVATISSAVVLIGTKPTVREGMFWQMSLAVATVPSFLTGRYIIRPDRRSEIASCVSVGFRLSKRCDSRLSDLSCSQSPSGELEKKKKIATYVNHSLKNSDLRGVVRLAN